MSFYENVLPWLIFITIVGLIYLTLWLGVNGIAGLEWK